MKEEAALGGIYDFNARFYDPAVGRFLSADTIVPRPSDPQSLNRYAFVRNSPLVRVDPTGHADCDDRQNDCDDIPTVTTPIVPVPLPRPSVPLSDSRDRRPDDSGSPQVIDISGNSKTESTRFIPGISPIQASWNEKHYITMAMSYCLKLCGQISLPTTAWGFYPSTGGGVGCCKLGASMVVGKPSKLAKSDVDMREAASVMKKFVNGESGNVTGCLVACVGYTRSRGYDNAGEAGLAIGIGGSVTLNQTVVYYESAHAPNGQPLTKGSLRFDQFEGADMLNSIVKYLWR
jgi:RHS repeat-associated protein